MERNVQNLADTSFDVLVVGGGVYGAALVREAATRGLRAALIEQNDFCSGTSANSLKIMHGGLRYLQQMDIPRVLESIRERSTWLRTAPHLVEPLDCIMPTRASLTRNRAVMSLGMAVNDVLSSRRNRGLDRTRRLAACQTGSRDACLEVLPALKDSDVSGGARWHDAIGFDTERIVISLLLDACDADATVANYVRASALILKEGTVTGVEAEDLVSHEGFSIRAEMVINAAGPWASELLEPAGIKLSLPCEHLAVGINLILKRWPVRNMAAGLTAGPGTPSGGRLFFFVPWRGVVMAGTYYRPHEGPVDAAAVTDEDIDAYLAALNSCYPGADLSRDDILMIHAGVLPAAHAAKAGKEPPLLRHYRLIDHGNADGVEGLLTVLGIKYTTARDVAQHAISVAVSRLSCPSVSSTTAARPLSGSVIGSLAGFRDATIEKYAKHTPLPVIDRLLRFYGSGIDAILATGDHGPLLEGSDSVLAREIEHVVATEMPQTLGDLLFRRTGLGSSGLPDPLLVRSCGAVMARACGWDAARLEREIDAVTKSTCLWKAATQV
ncbi:MAG: glycerol-3-phosphate dehydrogenase/oxidase [Kiritimatiellia bacterium]|jgi:glycerol-3-phosphate dehydrogenase|nr:glycerol-3-phosphate dehydrogenase/oxidase [Kiritimatiellia bacterium]MDP6631297.1 glycerol-3-phosphate dehydrogenase/oxidase [Kiritimatiellia bacterium]MDP6809628.1 glycerol-3-phosphate dehydrogenase/oxidase [Kiritimatiellia bacterium]MDP7023521.1 glycerol-3-phosphate dehydrogenase/oxidase [Kiritimatiellia bacterium]